MTEPRVGADVVFADGHHRYWSTHCRHGHHTDCKGSCKICAAPCVCPVDDCPCRTRKGRHESWPACTHQDPGEGLAGALDGALVLLRRFTTAYAPLDHQPDLAAWQRTLDDYRVAVTPSEHPAVLHPLYPAVLQAVSVLPAGPARESLLGVVRRHEPAHWAPERDWITCGECAVLSWPPPLEVESMWSDVVYPCATIIGIAVAFGLPVEPDYAPPGRIEQLIEASGLGTAEAVLLRTRTSPEVAARILERSRQISQQAAAADSPPDDGAARAG